jgi:hypothetical protein
LSVVTGFADLKRVKQLLNIPDSNQVSDEKIKTHMRDADSFINVQVGVHRDRPLTNPDDQLIALASGLSASLFNYWQTPAKNQTLDGIKQWEKRIGDHVRAFYGQEDITGHTGSTFTTTRGVTGTETGTGTSP